MDTDDVLVDVLGRAATRGILGEHMELLDANGARLARLERRLMP